MENKTILGIRLRPSPETAEKLQQVFSSYGCVIKTRLGLNEPEDNHSFPGGIILLELSGDDEECLKLEQAIQQMDGLILRKMTFPTPV